MTLNAVSIGYNLLCYLHLIAVVNKFKVEHGSNYPPSKNGFILCKKQPSISAVIRVFIYVNDILLENREPHMYVHGPDSQVHVYMYMRQIAEYMYMYMRQVVKFMYMYM